MLIAGASGHAVELLDLLLSNGYKEDICFYDDVNANDGLLFERFRIIRSAKEASAYFNRYDGEFALGIGKPAARKLLSEHLRHVGGELVSLIASDAHVGKHQVTLGAGLNIMPFSVITGRINIGEGTLVHVHASVHHDTIIGSYCELSPGSRILGGAKIGNLVSVGTNAVVMPNVVVGDRAVIGAGAVVVRDVAPGSIVKGVPAK